MVDDTETDDKLAKKLGPLLKRLEEQQAAQHDTLREIERVLAGDNPVLTLERYWLEAWWAVYREKYVWVYAKDRAQLKRLLKALTPDQIQARMSAYLSTREPFVERNRHSFGLFCSTINSYGGTEAKQRVIGCTHEPPCESAVQHTRRRVAEARS